MSLSPHLRTLRFAIRYWSATPRLLAVTIVLRLACNVFDIAIPTASGWLADSLVAPERAIDAPLRAIGFIIGFVVALHACRVAMTFALIRVTSVAMARLAEEAFAKVQRFSAAWHADAFAGATVRKVSRGMWALDLLGDTLIFSIVPTALAVLGTAAALALRWPPLALVVLVGVGIYVVVNVALSVLWVQPAGRLSQAQDSLVAAQLADAISGNQAVKDFAAEAREDAAFAAQLDALRRALAKTWDRDTQANALQTAIMVAMQAALLTGGVWLWTKGDVSPGDVVSLIGLQGLLNAYLRDFGQHVRNFQRCVTDMEDVVAFSEATPDVASVPGAPPLRVQVGEIRFDHVRFAYPAAAGPLFEDLNLVVRPGERVGLVGASGAGKSTFVKLLKRQFDLSGGHILVDGQDISRVTLESLRRGIGVVAQEPILFHRSLAENIAYGRPGASAAQIAQAARLAHADGFIDRLPLRYETLVGERGVKLSGGERQRVAIARAILAETPILVLDEATSSLDSIAEMHIRDALETLTRGRTTLVIAHRLSTVRRLDRILVFDHGRIVEDGTHDALLRREDGVYRRLFETQTLEALEIDEPI